jgi:hypothetical protein
MLENTRTVRVTWEIVCQFDGQADWMHVSDYTTEMSARKHLQAYRARAGEHLRFEAVKTVSTLERTILKP